MRSEKHVLLALAAFVLLAMPVKGEAQTAPDSALLKNSLESYFRSLNGVSEHVTMHGSYSVRVPCPNGRRCTWTRIVTIAAWQTTGGDDGGQALFSNSATCPHCQTTLTAGGGVLGISDIEKYGIDPATAKRLATFGH